MIMKIFLFISASCYICATTTTPSLASQFFELKKDELIKMVSSRFPEKKADVAEKVIKGFFSLNFGEKTEPELFRIAHMLGKKEKELAMAGNADIKPIDEIVTDLYIGLFSEVYYSVNAYPALTSNEFAGLFHFANNAGISSCELKQATQSKLPRSEGFEGALQALHQFGSNTGRSSLRVHYGMIPAAHDHFLGLLDELEPDRLDTLVRKFMGKDDALLEKFNTFTKSLIAEVKTSMGIRKPEDAISGYRSIATVLRRLHKIKAGSQDFLGFVERLVECSPSSTECNSLVEDLNMIPPDEGVVSLERELNGLINTDMLKMNAMIMLFIVPILRALIDQVVHVLSSKEGAILEKQKLLITLVVHAAVNVITARNSNVSSVSLISLADLIKSYSTSLDTTLISNDENALKRNFINAAFEFRYRFGEDLFSSHVSSSAEAATASQPSLKLDPVDPDQIKTEAIKSIMDYFVALGRDEWFYEGIADAIVASNAERLNLAASHLRLLVQKYLLQAAAPVKPSEWLYEFLREPPSAFAIWVVKGGLGSMDTFSQLFGLLNEKARSVFIGPGARPCFESALRFPRVVARKTAESLGDYRVDIMGGYLMDDLEVLLNKIPIVANDLVVAINKIAEAFKVEKVMCRFLIPGEQAI